MSDAASVEAGRSCVQCGSRYEQVTAPRVRPAKEIGRDPHLCPACVQKIDERDDRRQISKMLYTGLLYLDPLNIPVENAARNFLRAEPEVCGAYREEGLWRLSACARRAAAMLLRYAELREEVEAIEARAAAEISRLAGDRKPPSREVLNAIEVIMKREAQPLLLFAQIESLEPRE